MAHTKKLTHGSLFTGVGGFDIGFDAAKIKTLWQCEIDKKARSVLAKHWPNAVRYTDVCKLDGAKVALVDIVSFGSPCQDLSIAGKRAGFQDGTRSNLYFEAVRIIKEMRHATKNKYPQYAIWENVRGALSSNGGQDFGAAIQALADVGAMDVSWRLVNTCNFGPPQRRMRILVVADFRGERARKILSKPARVCWHPPTIGTARQKTTGTINDGLADSNQWAAGSNQQGVLRQSVASKWSKGSSGPSGDEYINMVVCNPILMDRAAFNQGFNAKYIAHISDDSIVPSLVARGPHAVAKFVYQYDGYNQKLQGNNVTQSLRTNRDSSDFVAVPELHSYCVRRLTPRECERLQGWPDDHTRWAEDGTELSDNARYKMVGNGVSAPVAQWLGENICAAQKSNHSR